MNFIKWKCSVLVIAIIGQVSAIRGRGANVGSSAFNDGAEGTSFSSFSSNGLSRTGSSRGHSGISTTAYIQNEAPKPYNFSYESGDERGTTHFHREEADASGTVRGSYGYDDFQGLYRIVEYVADAGGFRATLRTNEPGTDGGESPADVEMIAERPPPYIQDQYAPFRETGIPKVGVGYLAPVINKSFKSTLKERADDDDD